MDIRYATLADIPNILPLLEQLGYPTTAENLADRMRAYTDQEHYAVLVAEMDHQIVGMAALAFSERFVKEGKRCRVEALVVNVAHRRKGVGRALIEHAEELARQKGCASMGLTSGVRRASEGTHDFYRSLGYANEGEHAQVYLRKDL